MARRRRAPFVALVQLLQHHHPGLADPVEAVADGRVVVDGRAITNQNARVRADASVRVLAPRRLRGEVKLERAIEAFELDVNGAIAVDVGAAAGGFTSALLHHGAKQVYAVDVGFGQLTGRLRADERVVNLERTNVSSIDDRLVPDVVDVVTIDLSYLPVADAVQHLRRLRLAPDATLVALVKPTFELRAGSLVTGAHEVRRAVRVAIDAIELAGWSVVASTIPSITGAAGAIEAFVIARP